MRCFVLCCVLCWVLCTPGTSGTSPAEINALERLYYATNGEEWTRKDNWLVGDPCDNYWYGVGCEGGHVTDL